MDDRIQKLWQRGLGYFNQGNLDAAQASFEGILARDPGNGPARFRLSMVAMRRGNYQRAIALAREAHQIAPNQIEVNTHLARCLLQAGFTAEAESIAVSIESRAVAEGSAILLESLGTLFHMLGQSERALILLDRSNHRRPSQPTLLCIRAQALKACRRIDEAEQDLELCLAVESGNPQAHWQLAELREWQDSRNHVERLQGVLKTDGTDGPDSYLLWYALFKELDDLGRTEAAWPVLEKALAARRRQQRVDSGRENELFDALCNRFTKDAFPVTATAVTGSGPIFLVGMPRSGTALLEKILGRHSHIRGTGLKSYFLQIYSQMRGRQRSRELGEALLNPDADFDYAELGRRFLAAHDAHADGKAMFIENEPMNLLFLAFIHRALPNARILSVRRDPVDACFSMLCHPERGSSAALFDPLELAANHLARDRLLQHWHRLMPGNILDVQYESLVEKPEMVLRVVLAFLGLRYEAGMLAGTALHRDRIGRWQRYATQLEPMRERLQAPQATAEPAS